MPEAIIDGTGSGFLLKVNSDGSINTTGGGSSSSSNYAIQLNESGLATYIGEATIASSTGSAVWRIKQVYESGTSLTIKWASGNEAFDKVWDDHLTFTYI